MVVHWENSLFSPSTDILFLRSTCPSYLHLISRSLLVTLPTGEKTRESFNMYQDDITDLKWKTEQQVITESEIFQIIVLLD